MTRQEIFNTVVTALLNQGCRSVDLIGACSYRGVDGKKCAFGHLIPDELYSPVMEGRWIKRILMDYPSLETLLGMENQELMVHLQTIHDFREPEEWGELFKSYANEHGLVMP